MPELNQEFADKVVKISVEAYNKLRKTGKPVSGEWTVLSTIVQFDSFMEDLEVVALGTGSKCIGAVHMDPKGYILNDSHAEVVARRGFLLYLYDNMRRTAGGETTIFQLEDGKFKLDDNIEFYLYSSQVPCGDACIMPKNSDCDSIGELLGTRKRQICADIYEKYNKKLKAENVDIYRTGAKCLPDSEQQDPKLPGLDYHTVGQPRTKPGRGDLTMSMSCSDKLARWIYVGIQGALIDMFLHEPIYLKMFVCGSGVPYSKETLERACLKKHRNSEYELKNEPVFIQATINFPDGKTDDDVRLAPASLVWVKQQIDPCVEVATKGRKQGATAKTGFNSGASALCISKYELYKKFLSILKMLDADVLKNAMGDESIENIPYNEMKRRSKKYHERWKEVKYNVFGAWANKPDIFDFCVSTKT